MAFKYADRAKLVETIAADYYGAHVSHCCDEKCNAARYRVYAMSGNTIATFSVNFDPHRNTIIWDHIHPSVGLAQLIAVAGVPKRSKGQPEEGR